jgi:hypothetical protein
MTQDQRIRFDYHVQTARAFRRLGFAREVVKEVLRRAHEVREASANKK